MQASPPEAQINAAASVIAQLLTALKLGTNAVFGFSEIVNTQSPGATWPQWKGSLMAKVNALMGKPVVLPSPAQEPMPSQKPVKHYMLFWYNGPDDWAEWDLLGAMPYINKFSPSVGFSVEEAQFAQYVTIVGGTGGISADAEKVLANAGCKVERIAGETEDGTRQILEQMAANGQRFKTI